MTAQLLTADLSKIRAINVSMPFGGWLAQVWVNYAECFVTIAESPEFDTPEKAIRWGKKWANS